MLLDLDAIFDPDRRTRPICNPRDLPAEWREMFEERAAIMQYDAGLPRADAESDAFLSILIQLKTTNVPRSEVAAYTSCAFGPDPVPAT